jgi:hypothetical protein
VHELGPCDRWRCAARSWTPTWCTSSAGTAIGGGAQLAADLVHELGQSALITALYKSQLI